MTTAQNVSGESAVAVKYKNTTSNLGRAVSPAAAHSTCHLADIVPAASAVMTTSGYVPSGTMTASQFNANVKSARESTNFVRISSGLVKSIPKGSTYREILNKLGKTADYHLTNLAIYNIDGSKLLVLRFDNSDDICPLSGGQLLDSAIPVEKQFDGPNTKFCIISRIHSYPGVKLLEVCSPTYGNNPSNPLYYASLKVDGKTQIVFRNGKPATADDIVPADGLAITYQSPARQVDPPMMIAAKIVLLK